MANLGCVCQTQSVDSGINSFCFENIIPLVQHDDTPCIIETRQCQAICGSNVGSVATTTSRTVQYSDTVPDDDSDRF